MEQPMVPTQFGLSETNILNFLSEFKRQYLEQIVDSFEKAEKKELKNNKNEKIYLEREINDFDQQNKEEIPQKNRKIRREMSLEKDSDRRKEIKILRNKIFDSSGEEKFMFQEKLKNLIIKWKAGLLKISIKIEKREEIVSNLKVSKVFAKKKYMKLKY